MLLALNDRLVADLGTEFLFPLLRRAPAELRVTDVLAFIELAASSRTEVSAWSENTCRSLAQDYCASIRDFGLAKGIIEKDHGSPGPLRIAGAATRKGASPDQYSATESCMLLCVPAGWSRRDRSHRRASRKPYRRTFSHAGRCC